ncbi:MAG: HNH endonuclease [Bacteroidetes bacterium]|nr:HNH endonuclease [Bacteroidota bacterium]
MKGLMLLSESLNTILEIHESLSRFYMIILTNIQVLRKYGSERLRQLGHEPKLIFEFAKDIYPDHEEKLIESVVIKSFREIGIKKNHWLIKERILVETEYMLDTLQILVEPEFIPLEEKGGESDDSETIDRYIPPAVKLAVWRRDQGKCVQCKSKEKLEYDHIIPISKGGSNTERNVQLLCEKCNRDKSAKIA